VKCEGAIGENTTTIRTSLGELGVQKKEEAKAREAKALIAKISYEWNTHRGLKQARCCEKRGLETARKKKNPWSHRTTK